jgi:putative transcriptional regulator
MRWQYDPKEIRSSSMQRRSEQEQPFNRLRYERLRRGWLQAELAKKVHATAVSVCRWESGKVIPQPIYCRRLCKVLEIGLEELFPEGLRRSHTDKVHTIASITFTQANGLRQARLQRGLSQMELAKKVGTSRGSVNRWECGLGSPNLPHLRKLCQFLGVPAEELFPDTISKPGPPTQDEAEETRTHVPTFRSSGQHFFDY